MTSSIRSHRSLFSISLSMRTLAWNLRCSSTVSDPMNKSSETTFNVGNRQWNHADFYLVEHIPRRMLTNSAPPRSRLRSACHTQSSGRPCCERWARWGELTSPILRSPWWPTPPRVCNVHSPHGWSSEPLAPYRRRTSPMRQWGLRTKMSSSWSRWIHSCRLPWRSSSLEVATPLFAFPFPKSESANLLLFWKLKPFLANRLLRSTD